MKVEVESTSPIERKVSVEIPWEVVEGELNEAYRALGKRARVKGFRAGKVPRKVLEQYYRGTVEGEVINRLVDDGFKKAVEENALYIISRPRLDDVPKVVSETPLRFAAVVEVKPEVSVDNWRGLEVEKEVPVISDEAVASELQQLREKAVVLEQVEDRTEAQDGDVAVVDFFGELNGKPFKGGKGINYSVHLGAGEMVPGFEAGILGMTIGDQRTFDVTFPKDYGSEEVRGQTVQFTVDLKEIKTKIYPDLDDEFAKDLGEFDSLEELQAKVRENLSTRENAKAERGLKDQLLKKLVEANPVEVPPSMVDRQVELTLQDARRAFQGKEDPAFEGLLQRMASTMRPQATQQVAGMLLLEGLVRSEGIDISDEELDGRIQELAREHRITPKQAKQQLRQNEQLETLRYNMQQDKALDLVLRHANVLDKPVGSPSATAEDTESTS